MPRYRVYRITTDQQRWDALPCYGLDFITTPALDRMAHEGLVFERCYTPAPLCVPARAALQNSMYRIDPSRATPEQHRRWRAHYRARTKLPGVATIPFVVGTCSRLVTVKVPKMRS